MYKIILLSILCCLCFTACENGEETEDQTTPQKKEVLVESSTSKLKLLTNVLTISSHMKAIEEELHSKSWTLTKT